MATGNTMGAGVPIEVTVRLGRPAETIRWVARETAQAPSSAAIAPTGVSAIDGGGPATGAIVLAVPGSVGLAASFAVRAFRGRA